MSFIRVVMTCQPVYKTHISAIFIPDPRPSWRDVVLKEPHDDVKVFLALCEPLTSLTVTIIVHRVQTLFCAFVSA